MAKEDTVAAQLAAIQQGEQEVLVQALGACYDQGAVDQKASDGTLSQADVDAAVAKAVADVQAVDAQVLADSQAKDAADLQAAQLDGQKAVADVQAQLDAMAAAKEADDQAIQGLQKSVASVQQALDAIKAIVFA